MSNLANNEDRSRMNEMPHNAAFHQVYTTKMIFSEKKNLFGKYNL